jgi:hypothetical protein
MGADPDIVNSKGKKPFDMLFDYFRFSSLKESKDEEEREREIVAIAQVLLPLML